jgi:hypothetical protein
VSPPWDAVMYILIVVQHNTDIGTSGVGELFLHCRWLCYCWWLCQQGGYVSDVCGCVIAGGVYQQCRCHNVVSLVARLTKPLICGPNIVT